MPSKPVLSDADKKAIRERLGELCEECWIAHGYKKTSIKNLCDNAGISIGTFYTLCRDCTAHRDNGPRFRPQISG